MPDPVLIPKSKSDSVLEESTAETVPSMSTESNISSSAETPPFSPKTPLLSGTSSTPPPLSRNSSFTAGSSYHDDWDAFPPLDKLTIFDLLENIALPQRLEKWQNAISAQKEKFERSTEKLKTRSVKTKDRMVEEWRRRIPADEQLDKYRKRMKVSVDRVGRRWNDAKIVTVREKLSFIASVLNILVSGYLIGAYPQYFYYWFTAQLLYYMPIRYYTYHKKGYHYFLADLCYFVNVLTLLSVWVFPRSKRLFISSYCLAYGNNAVAIAMWRNSMVFHSMDKMVSLFIHIMPPVTLHCLVHLTPPEVQMVRFPAIYSIRFSKPGDPIHYTLPSMIVWASVPYAIWQLTYHLLITVRRREKIAAGRPTSFTWLRKSYAKTWIGRSVLALPNSLQEPYFMLIQYCYALLTMLPCSLWFWSKHASAAFLLVVLIWSVYNGATFYLDVFGKQFQKELEQLRRDVAKWQNSPDGGVSPPFLSTEIDKSQGHRQKMSVDCIPLLDAKPEPSTTSAETQPEGKDATNLVSKEE
ncbi:MAG: hypothetical protein M1834_000780 [Cirrosporium novae-zelandiae]|nr:MAG: hypothetical protein M1834_000780 [Cirrosporium novae-zelandiae]